MNMSFHIYIYIYTYMSYWLSPICLNRVVKHNTLVNRCIGLNALNIRPLCLEYPISMPRISRAEMRDKRRQQK